MVATRYQEKPSYEFQNLTTFFETKSLLNGQVCDRKLSAYSYSSLVFVQVVGCADALKIDKHWSNLVVSSQQRRRYFKVLNPWTLNPCTITGNERLKVQRFQDFVV
jgi:hypothetical protein